MSEHSHPGGHPRQSELTASVPCEPINGLLVTALVRALPAATALPAVSTVPASTDPVADLPRIVALSAYGNHGPNDLVAWGAWKGIGTKGALLDVQI